MLADELYSQGFHIIDDFLDESIFHSLRELAETSFNKDKFQDARIGSGSRSSHHSEIRNDKILWLDEQNAEEPLSQYFCKINSLRQILNQSLFLGLADFETHFARYQPGSFYKKHVDQFAHSKDRRISCVYYLNNLWQKSFGGELNLYDCQNNLLASVLPQANRFICFSSDLPHEVSITQEIRYSLAGWMKTRPLSGNSP